MAIQHSRRLLTVPAMGLLLCITGCETSVIITPDLGRGAQGACTVTAPMSYEGNPDYLPQAVAAEPVAARATVLRYTYNTQYDAKQGITALQVVNSCLMIVGFPTMDLTSPHRSHRRSGSRSRRPDHSLLRRRLRHEAYWHRIFGRRNSDRHASQGPSAHSRQHFGTDMQGPEDAANPVRRRSLTRINQQWREKCE